MKILIVGTGTIGKPLIRLFLRMRNRLDFEEIIYHKNSPELKCRGMLEYFHHEGAKLAVYSERMEEFTRLLSPRNFKPDYTIVEAMERADLIIDCSNQGKKLKERYYQNLGGKLGFIAQGSETGFGKPYAFGINDQALRLEDKFIQVVSCNTHQILCLLKTLAFDPQNTGTLDFNNLVRARFYLARRDSDISQENGKVGVVVGKPVHSFYGSHQAEDAISVLQTINPNITLNLDDIHAVADTFNNPFMHVVNFEIKLMEVVSEKEVEKRFRANPLTAVTYEITNNQVFAIGRDLGHFGRFLNHTIVCLPSLQVIGNGREIVGRCFTPQDGNPLLSSMSAALWFRDPSAYRQEIEGNFFKLPFIFDEV